MVASATGSLSDRRIANAMACLEDDERYRNVIRSRIQRRRGNDKRIQRSYSCEDLPLIADRVGFESSAETSECPNGTVKRMSSSVDRYQITGLSRRPKSPAEGETGGNGAAISKEGDSAKTQKTSKGKSTSRNKKDKKTRQRRHTKTVCFPANPLLHYAVLENDMDLIKRLLEGDATTVDTLSKEGTAPLHEAALNGNIDCVDLLLSCGAQVDVFDIEGYTPLEYAVYAGQFDCASVLINAGADVTKIKDGCVLGLGK